MNKQLCFILDSKEIYLDKGLVYFNDTPIFFVCIDMQKHYYLALCIDINDLEYVIVNVSKKSLWEMLTKKLTMRETLLNCEFFWSVKAGEEISSDIVELKRIADIDCDVLPVEGAMYEQINEDDSIYVDRISSEFLNEVTFDSLEYRIKDLNEVPSEVIGSFIKGATKVVEYLDFGPVIQHMTIGLKKAFSNVNEVINTTVSYEQPPKTKENISFSINTTNNSAVELNDVINIAA